jgi:hypothetical protein
LFFVAILGHYLSNYDVGKSLCDFVPSCAGHSDGFYLDRTKPNCQSYIQCLDNRVANHSRCSHGQRFNRNIGRCAPSDQVPCRGELMRIIKNDLQFCFFVAYFSSIIDSNILVFVNSHFYSSCRL